MNTYPTRQSSGRARVSNVAVDGEDGHGDRKNTREPLKGVVVTCDAFLKVAGGDIAARL